MKPLKTLPANYVLLRQLDLSADRKMLVRLNLVGLVLFFLFGWLFSWIAIALRNENRPQEWQISWLTGLLSIVVAFVTILFLHELVHGLFFWIITRSSPHFGLRAAYAYASAPDWYIPRNAYLVVGLAPLVFITIIGVAMIPFMRVEWLLPLVFALATNASGAVGDAYIVAWLLRQPPDVLVNDHGDAIWFYKPQGGG